MRGLTKMERVKVNVKLEECDVVSMAATIPPYTDMTGKRRLEKTCTVIIKEEVGLRSDTA